MRKNIEIALKTRYFSLVFAVVIARFKSFVSSLFLDGQQFAIVTEGVLNCSKISHKPRAALLIAEKEQFWFN